MTKKRLRSKPPTPRRGVRVAGDTGQAVPAWLDRLQTSMGRTLIRQIAAALVLGSFVVQGAIAARTHTPTPDEFVDVPEGYYLWRTGDFSFDTTNPPLLKMITALPLLRMDLKLDTDPRWRDNRTGWGAWIFGTRFMELNPERYLDAFFAARLMVLAIGVALGILVFWKATTVLSPIAALAVLILYGHMPPLIAHSAVATLDLGVTGLIFGAFVALERFVTGKASKWAAITGALGGSAIAVKTVAALFIPLAAVLMILSWRAWSRYGIRQLAAGVALMAVAGWLAIETAYGFSDFPMPAALVEGVRFQMTASSTGEFPAFLNGRWSQTGWWYYYLVALALKVPIPTLILMALASVELIRRRQDRAAWIVLPPVFLLYILSFHYAKDYGVRYLLPAFPFFLLLAGRGIDSLLRFGRYGIAGAVVLLAWQIVVSIAGTPHHLAYFNELAGGADHERHLLLDSNLDWGQDLGRLASYLKIEGISNIHLGYFGHVDPHLYGIQYTFPPTTPTPGRYAISANFLAGYPYGITYAGDRYPRAVPHGAWSWLDDFQPSLRVGRSIYIFDIAPEHISQHQR